MTNHAQRNLLHAYLDDELDLVRSMELEDHLAECGDCANEMASYRALREGVQANDLRYQASAEFGSRLLTELRKKEEPQQVMVVHRRIARWSWAAVAALLPVRYLVTFSSMTVSDFPFCSLTVTVVGLTAVTVPAKCVASPCASKSAPDIATVNEQKISKRLSISFLLMVCMVCSFRWTVFAPEKSFEIFFLF